MVRRRRWSEIQVVDVHPEDSKDTASSGKVAPESLLKVRNAASTPMLDIVYFEKMHLLKDFDRRHNIAAIKNRSHRTNDPRIEPVGAIFFQRDLLHDAQAFNY
jgi:hypothetical protein